MPCLGTSRYYILYEFAAIARGSAEGKKMGPVGLPAGPGDPLPLARGRDLEEISE